MKRGRQRKSLFDRITSLVKSFAPSKQETDAKNKNKYFERQLKEPTKEVKALMRQGKKLQFKEETNISKVYEKQYEYENEIRTGKEILTMAGKTSELVLYQLEFIDALKKNGYIKDIPKTKQKKQSQSIQPKVSIDAFPEKLGQYYAELYKYEGLKKCGKEIIKQNGMIDRSYAEQIRFFENLLAEGKAMELITLQNGKLLEEMSKRELSQLTKKEKVEVLCKEQYMHYEVRKTGQVFLQEIGKHNNHDDTKLAMFALQIRTGKLRPFHKEIIRALFPEEVAENDYRTTQASVKAQVAHVPKSPTRVTPPKQVSNKLEALYARRIYVDGKQTTGKEILKSYNKLHNQESTQIAFLEATIRNERLGIKNYGEEGYQDMYYKPQKRANMSKPKNNVVQKNNAIPQNKPKPNSTQPNKKQNEVSQASEPIQEESLGKMFGMGAGFGAGLVLGGPIALAGELLNSETLKNVGEKVIVATTQTGAIVGEAANGGVNAIVGTISDDAKAVERGKGQLASAGKTLGNSAAQTIGNVFVNGMDIYEGIRDGDKHQLKSGAKHMAENVVVGSIAFGVLDGVSSIDSNTDSYATADSNISKDHSTDAAINPPSSNESFVKPHEVSAHYRGDTYIEAYVRDGDGDTSIDRTVNEGGGYMRNNPS